MRCRAQGARRMAWSSRKLGLFSFALYPGPLTFRDSLLIEGCGYCGKVWLLTYIPCSVRSGESRIYYALGWSWDGLHIGLCLELGPMCFRIAYILRGRYRKYCDSAGFIYLKQEYTNKSRGIYFYLLFTSKLMRSTQRTRRFITPNRY